MTFNFASLAGKATIAAGALLVSVPAYAAEIETDNPYGLLPALKQGGPIAWFLFGVLLIMSLGTWYILFTKYLDQRRIMKEAKEVDKKFWSAPSLREGASKLPKNSPYRMIVDDGLRASEHHEGRLTDKIDEHEWVTMSLERSQASIAAKLAGGLSFLASVGSTAPFVGLLGTVVGIYRALIGIGVAGQASIDKVAGPVGEALIMTALGLFVAVPAVLAYNWLLGRNKDVLKHLSHFADDVHGFLVSGSRVSTTTTSAAPSSATAGVRSAGTASTGSTTKTPGTTNPATTTTTKKTS
ncbi:flagellar motor protein MotA [Pacificimonas flava]|uniref:Biopolymer transport protein ExbB n=2 Tax=Pacificimonas TaxID=1960290 RepID=A0A219B9J9_9SPHN|nr:MULTISPECIES: MotA/TolQ/ExbB proton channel family protein [Pacificimonas]MBZ6379925.1 MotA/TolQ/ExbB proton channel family protein [Pacificimonas aurantium]OWV34448.1 flagellar motor protein MotA [Pacificimonas flava]